MRLHCIAYISNVAPSLHDSQLDKILDTDIRHNSANDITGVLYKYGSVFIQVLEGGKSALETRVSDIKINVRNHNLNEVYNDSIPERKYSRL